MTTTVIINFYKSVGLGLIALSVVYMTVNIIRRMVNKR